MSSRKIATIIQKEWAEVFKNRMVLFTVIFLPLLMTAIPLVTLYFTGGQSSSDLTTDMPPQFAQLCSQELTSTECFQVFMVQQFMVLFMMIPLIIPVNIAAYSVVGEKTNRSLEPLLATPITTAELLTGKNLSAAIPAILATWLGFLIYMLGAAAIVQSSQVFAALLDPVWLLAVIIVGPLMAILSVNFSLMVSSRVNDPRVAEQLSAIVIVPVLALFFGQIAGLFFISQAIIWIIVAALLLLDGAAIYGAIRLFQRETILTRWK
jgi:ABC-2 type transport system permease protein